MRQPGRCRGSISVWQMPSVHGAQSETACESRPEFGLRSIPVTEYDTFAQWLKRLLSPARQRKCQHHRGFRMAAADRGYNDLHRPARRRSAARLARLLRGRSGLFSTGRPADRGPRCALHCERPRQCPGLRLCVVFRSADRPVYHGGALVERSDPGDPRDRLQRPGPMQFSLDRLGLARRAQIGVTSAWKVSSLERRLRNTFPSCARVDM